MASSKSKPTHGGKRKGAGRKSAPEPIEQHTITFYTSHVKLLQTIDPNLSKAIRKLISKVQSANL